MLSSSVAVANVPHVLYSPFRVYFVSIHVLCKSSRGERWQSKTHSRLMLHTSRSNYSALSYQFRKVQQLNNSLFDGYPVLMERDGTILFETDMIRLNETVYVDRTNTGEYNGKTLSTSAYNSPLHAVTAQPVDATNENYVSMANAVPVQNVRTLLVRVPNNAGHGSVLSVTAPDGSMLSVSDITISVPHCQMYDVLIASCAGGCASQFTRIARNHRRVLILHPRSPDHRRPHDQTRSQSSFRLARPFSRPNLSSC